MTDIRLDLLLQPYTDVLFDRADLRSGQRVVDVGCGAGAVTRAAAQICGEGVVGVDVSGPSLAVARQRAPAVAFVEADAAVWRPTSPVDRIVSRFGVMFFADPEGAFHNMHSWLTPGGTLNALVWRAGDLNRWVGEPFRLFASHLQLPTTAQEGPGPHSMADPDRVRELLAAFGTVELEPREVRARIDGDESMLLAFYREWCPLSRMYQTASKEVQAAITLDLRALVARKFDGRGMDLVGRIWAIRATR